MTDRYPAPAPPPGSLSLPEVIYQSALMTPFKLHGLLMTEEDTAYCTSLARKLTGDEAHWLLQSFLRFFTRGSAQAPSPPAGPAHRETRPR